MRFLVTRPQPACARTAQRIRALGHEADEMPLLAETVIAPKHLDLTGVSALAVTSSRVASALSAHPQLDQVRALPVFAVGNRTAGALLSAGWRDVRSAGGTASDLARLIIGERPRGTVLYLSAADRAAALEDDLGRAGILCRVCEVYRMDQITALADSVRRRLEAGAYDGVLIFSRRTADAFAAALQGPPAVNLARMPRVYAISPQAGAPLTGMTDLEIAAEPTEDGVLDVSLRPR